MAGSLVLGDQPGELGPGEAGRLREEALHKALAGPPQPVVLEPLQRAPDEGVGLVAVGGVEIRGLVAVQEGVELLESPSVRCEASRSSSNDLTAPPFGLISRWKPAASLGSSIIGRDSGLTLSRGAGYVSLLNP